MARLSEMEMRIGSAFDQLTTTCDQLRRSHGVADAARDAEVQCNYL